MDAETYYAEQERWHVHRCVDCGAQFRCHGELCADSEWALCADCACNREDVYIEEAT